ncbi:hypothetical protein PIB30_090743 [Stylosanthes scabra]|uniref:Uncharacterized protein n=1 Tax=Stylosanthes scabra TaxID=79078 RepID=A0ABU6XTG7_9FABA|nr:hypothetical protein [Stylosanthes scabra]
MDRTIPTLAPQVHWVHLNVPSSVGTEVTNIHWWGAGLRSPYLTTVSPVLPVGRDAPRDGHLLSPCRWEICSRRAFSSVEGFGGPKLTWLRQKASSLKARLARRPSRSRVPKPHCWKGSASKPYVELLPHTAPLGMEVGPSQACAVNVVVHDLIKRQSLSE